MKLVSYNVQYGTGKDGQVDIDRIVGEIADGDVIAMQEVDRFWTRSEMADQVQAFIQALPDHCWVYGPGVDLDASYRDADGILHRRRRQFGNLLLSRFPILASRNHLLPKMNFHAQLSIQRTMLDGTIAFPSGPVRIASVHLAHAAEPERLAQVAYLRALQRDAGRDGGVLTGAHSHWLERPPIPAEPASSILLGDFNMSPNESAYAALVGPVDPKYGRLTATDGYLDAWIHCGGDPNGGHTKFEDSGNRRIDYAFVSTDLAARAQAVRVDVEALGSDHQPIWLKIDL
jgi:endonuclease/exonuclease/phosphatase family metal-dependent hydrolase